MIYDCFFFLLLFLLLIGYSTKCRDIKLCAVFAEKCYLCLFIEIFQFFQNFSQVVFPNKNNFKNEMFRFFNVYFFYYCYIQPLLRNHIYIYLSSCQFIEVVIFLSTNPYFIYIFLVLFYFNYKKSVFVVISVAKFSYYVRFFFF